MTINELINIKLQKEDACPDCGGDLDTDGACPSCEPKVDLDEEEDESEKPEDEQF